MEDGEKQAGVGGHPALLAQGVGIQPGQGVVFEGGEAGEISEGLIGKGVAIGKKQNARPAGGLAREIPAGLEQLPEDLKGDGGFAGAGGEGEQDAGLTAGDGLQGARRGDVLIEADLPAAALVGIGNGGEAIAPGIFLGEAAGPELLGRGEGGHRSLFAAGHVDGIDAEAVAGEGEAEAELVGVVLGLGHPFREGGCVGLRLHHRQLGVAVAEHVVGGERLAAAAAPLQPTGRDRKLTPDTAALHDTPAGGSEQRIDPFSAGFGLVHGSREATWSRRPARR